MYNHVLHCPKSLLIVPTQQNSIRCNPTQPLYHSIVICYSSDTPVILSTLGPSWLKNLYFAYLLVLRAVTKAESHWKDYTFYTGDAIQERELKENVMEIVQAAK